MTDYEKLKNIIDKIDELIDMNVDASNPKFEAWQTSAERFLVKKYGENSLEHKKFKDTSFSLMVFALGTPDSAFVKACREGLESTKAVFLTYLEELEEEIVTVPIFNNSKYPALFSKIFIVHGHDSGLKHEVARLVENQGLTAVILSEQANKGKTIIEKIEEYSDVSGAICLFTADDFGRAKNADSDNTRARQNVVLETGYFMGKLGRNRTVILMDEGIELPSDLSGMVYTSTNNWQVNLLKDLKAMGYNVDFNKLF